MPGTGPLPVTPDTMKSKFPHHLPQGAPLGAPSQPPTRSPRKNGFTLVEILVVIVIIIVLAAVVFSITMNVRRSAIKVADMSNLRSLATAVMAAGADNAGRLPAIHAGTDKGNTNAAPYYLVGANSLMAYGINREACYIPRKDVVGGAPLYKWWTMFGMDSQTPIHYNYFANDAPNGKDPWFMKGSVVKPSKAEYRGAIPYETIMKDPSKAFARSITDDAWYPVLWSGLCRDYPGSDKVAALMEKGEPLGVNVMYLDSHAQWIPKEKMKTRYTAGSLKVSW
jgi:prepilin-type N-terminal cleavage/methylation domain-containing protein